ncbi:MAG: pyrroline-5-carboxylate reductase [Eubacteriales bacterium]|jgi:pyrroline-5-carboxylate reductase|nr:pyrroline-5-carboxylate reductase [Eubacteriales bacterium]
MLRDKKIGFIGVGNMGGAIIKGLVASNAVCASDISVCDLSAEKTLEFEKMGCKVYQKASQLCENSHIVVLAVKPNAFTFVLKDLRHITSPLYISIAAGIEIDYIKSFFDGEAKVARVMPNTPALIGEGATVVSVKDPVSAQELEIVCEIFRSIGIVEVMDEKYMNAVVAVSGSSPAYVYMMIEAMADAAVADGISRDVAYRLAAQAVAGSAKMVLESKEHPGALKDKVCSPGGTTIQAVAKLEETGFRNSIISAMKACTKKAEELSK